ncbi:L-threonine dehydratase catabolic TdcB [Planctomycetes bacterium Pan216]|uniref:L-threonine dehydratase catabolic TdcB n=1 Tax=Kolteria novifilia TaxID=2527975 RepID=A0A518B094_9BACT|nr:L-threonine dehydratase catabolic TdcB [Planctomycetes bacterium Pan216]
MSGVNLSQPMQLLSLDQVSAARASIGGRLYRTPTLHSRSVSDDLGVRTYLKHEHLQRTGSFKPRGAFHKLLSLTAFERERGVVAASGGNHAQGLAFAASSLGIASTICMPRGTSANYLDATRGYGATIVLCEDIADAFAQMAKRASSGLTPVHPFDDPLIAAGQGTVGLEILDDVPDVSRVYVSIGGGGLIAGIAAAIRALSPTTKIIGVETRGADTMAKSRAAGELIELPAITSIARTLGAPRVSAFTLNHVEKLVDDVVVVDDAAAMAALEFLLERTKQLVEPAAACSLAAARLQADSFGESEKVVVLLCGGNISLADLCVYRRQFLDAGPL